MFPTFILLISTGCIYIFFSTNEKAQKFFSLIVTAIAFVLSLFLWLFHQSSLVKSQSISLFSWLNFLNFNFLFGIDGISLIFVVLTTYLFFICSIASWKTLRFQTREFLLCFLSMELILLGVFFASDLTLFYILFESVLIPMFIIIGLEGSRERKIRAAYMFFIYTIVGSVLMLLSIVFLEIRVGSCYFNVVKDCSLSILEQKALWIGFFVAFAGKVPMMPLHVWLPEAHVEAPTIGSVILAGILLKLGTYGLIRVSIGIFGKIGVFFTPFVNILGLIGLIYSSFTAIRQVDFKRLIAYTSVAHMNLVVLGIFSYTILGLEGAIFQSLSHGFVSSALFFLIGVLYDRYHSRLLSFYSGIAFFMPNFIILLVFFSLANIGMPGTSSFIGEFLLLLGVYKTNTILCFFSCFSMVLSGAYSLWLLNRIAFGNFNYSLKPMKDLVLRENFVFFGLILATLFWGICSDLVLKEIHFNVIYLL